MSLEIFYYGLILNIIFNFFLYGAHNQFTVLNFAEGSQSGLNIFVFAYYTHVLVQDVQQSKRSTSMFENQIGSVGFFK
jgi:hypothetical protein